MKNAGGCRAARWLASVWMGALLVLAVPAPALAQAWQVDPAHSTLAFSNTYQAVSYTGQFRRFTARIAYDPADVAHSKFDVTVDVASLDTENSERDHAALGTAFFDAARYPRAYFVTTVFHQDADGKVTADGELGLRGVIRPVVLAVDFVQHGSTATLDVTAHLKRLDFGIGGGEWADPSMIGDGVTVHGHLMLHAQGQPAGSAGPLEPHDR